MAFIGTAGGAMDLPLGTRQGTAFAQYSDFRQEVQGSIRVGPDDAFQILRADVSMASRNSDACRQKAETTLVRYNST
jgi:hypothetical protein